MVKSEWIPCAGIILSAAENIGLHLFIGQLFLSWGVHGLNHLKEIVIQLANKYDGNVTPLEEIPRDFELASID